ncbi:MAG: carboxypeptidase-like regulatory domain-containing protein [Chitinophagaceae bacterium]
MSGTVLSEERKPLEGVTVTVRGTNRRTQTNTVGYYTILARPGQELVFTFVGSGAQTKTVGNVWERSTSPCSPKISNWAR